jgi:hypothetical protein
VIGKAIVANVEQRYKKIGMAQKLAIPDQIVKPDGYCTFCHATFQPDDVLTVKTLNNVKFDHVQHVEMGTECTKCHDPARHRLGAGLRTAACKECRQDKKF